MISLAPAPTRAAQTRWVSYLETTAGVYRQAAQLGVGCTTKAWQMMSGQLAKSRQPASFTGSNAIQARAVLRDKWVG